MGRLGIYVRVGLLFLSYFCSGWDSIRVGLGMNYTENMFLLEKMDFGELDGILRGLWGSLQSRGWVVKREKR